MAGDGGVHCPVASFLVVCILLKTLQGIVMDYLVGCVAQWLERRSLSLASARSAADV